MSTPEPEPLRIEIAPDESVTALIYPASSVDRAGVTLILGHGAGADQTSAFMVSVATALAARGHDVVTFNFRYTERRGRLPDPNPRLEACYRSVIEAMRRHPPLERNALAIGGKSMGGRIASQVAAAGVGALAGLVLLGYPLHPPGKPDRLRSKHLPAIAAPLLFVPVELYVVAGGDHSFKVPKRAGVAQSDVDAAIQERIDRWLRSNLIASGGGR